MLNRSKIILAISILVGAAIILFVANAISPFKKTLPVDIASSTPAQSISTATSTVISSTTQKMLLATTTPNLNLPKKPLIVTSTPPATTVTTTVTPPPALTTTTPATSSITDSDPPQITPDPQTIVGILCYYNATYTDENTGQTIYSPDDEEVRGSGVIINSSGNILTNRHIVVQPEAYSTIDDNNGNAVPVSIIYQLDHCEVGQLPEGSTLSSASQIESINPYIQIPVLGYTAQPVFISSSNGLSAGEVQYADFAVLKITGVSSSGPTFGINSVPNSFPYATLLPIAYEPDVLNAQVLTYGFPGDVTAGQGNFFQTLTMTGSVGTVTSVEDGDQFYANTPLVINTNLAIAHGRSGSPLFWRGYVIGLVTFFVGDNDTQSGSVASDAILKGLRNTGYIAGN